MRGFFPSWSSGLVAKQSLCSKIRPRAEIPRQSLRDASPPPSPDFARPVVPRFFPFARLLLPCPLGPFRRTPYRSSLLEINWCYCARARTSPALRSSRPRIARDPRRRQRRATRRKQYDGSLPEFSPRHFIVPISPSLPWVNVVNFPRTSEQPPPLVVTDFFLRRPEIPPPPSSSTFSFKTFETILARSSRGSGSSAFAGSSAESFGSHP